MCSLSNSSLYESVRQDSHTVQINGIPFRLVGTTRKWAETCRILCSFTFHNERLVAVVKLESIKIAVRWQKQNK